MANVTGFTLQSNQDWQMLDEYGTRAHDLDKTLSMVSITPET